MLAPRRCPLYIIATSQSILPKGVEYWWASVSINRVTGNVIYEQLGCCNLKLAWQPGAHIIDLYQISYLPLTYARQLFIHVTHKPLFACDENIVCEMAAILSRGEWINSSHPGQNGRYFADDILICIFVNERVFYRIKFHWSMFLRVQLSIAQYWFR